MVVKNALQDVQREIAVMKKIKHPNVIRLLEVIENPNTDKIYMGISFVCSQ
jgi:[calcium/calmodulin-dependent protein kinase] kinase